MALIGIIALILVAYGILKILQYFRYKKVCEYLEEARLDLTERLSRKPDVLEDILKRINKDFNRGVKGDEILKRHLWH